MHRALDNPKFILIDEGDFFRKGEQDDVRHVSERFFAKSDPYIVMVSTPNAPDGLVEKIEKEPEETCIYKRLLLDYTYGLDKIYAQEEFYFWYSTRQVLIKGKGKVVPAPLMLVWP